MWFAPFLPILLIGGVVGSALLYSSWAERRTERVLKALATALGLHHGPATVSRVQQIVKGQIGSVPIEIRHGRRGFGKSSHEYIEARVGSGLAPRELQIRLRHRVLRALLPAGGMSTGDPDFDRMFVVQGPEEKRHALLDAETRALLQAQLPGSGGALRDGQLVLDLGYPPPPIERCRDRLMALLEVARALSSRGRSDTSIARAAATDPLAAVRLANLQQLLRRGHRSPQALEAFRRAAASDDRAHRLLGGLGLGRDGLPQLWSLYRDEEASPEQRTRALTGLLRHSRDPMQLVRENLALPPDAPAAVQRSVAAIDLLGRRRSAPERLDLLAQALEGNPDRAIWRAVSEALGAAGPEAQPLLLRLLSSPDSDAACRAAERLAVVGSRSAVEHLLPHTRGLFKNADLKAAAQAAVFRIQLRLGEGDAGALALAGSPDGGLSAPAATSGTATPEAATERPSEPQSASARPAPAARLERDEEPSRRPSLSEIMKGKKKKQRSRKRR